MPKISIIGAGNVGATAAYTIAKFNFVTDVVLLDIKPGLAEGKSFDMMQASRMLNIDSRITGVTGDYEATKDSDVVIITSGIPRKPGMTREQLIGTNAGIVKDVVSNIMRYSPLCRILVVSNPMDTMAYLTTQISGLPPRKVIGMGGMLDSSRFNYYLSQALKAPLSDIDSMVIGGHSDTTMVPLMSRAYYKGGKLGSALSVKEKNEVINKTKIGGATLTKLIGTSAWYAPGTAVAALAKAIIMNEKRLYTCSCYLNGQYGEKDICLGVPCIIGKHGAERVIEFGLTKTEMKKFKESASAIRKTNNILHEMKAI
ncbi:MAG: malate dehydrogenase [Bacteroidales bacterium]